MDPGDSVFHQCRKCRKYFKGTTLYREHKNVYEQYGSCEGTTKRPRLDSGGYRRIGNNSSNSSIGQNASSKSNLKKISPLAPPAAIEIIKPEKPEPDKVPKIIPPVNIEDLETETEECSSGSPIPTNTNKRKLPTHQEVEIEDEDDGFCIQIVSVVGRGGVTEPIQLESDEENNYSDFDEGEGIVDTVISKSDSTPGPILLENIKMEPCFRPPSSSESNFEKRNERELLETRRLEIKIEPIEEAVRKYFFNPNYKKTESTPVNLSSPSCMKVKVEDAKKTPLPGSPVPLPEACALPNLSPYLPQPQSCVQKPNANVANVSTFAGSNTPPILSPQKENPANRASMKSEFERKHNKNVQDYQNIVKQINEASIPKVSSSQLEGTNGNTVVFVGAWFCRDPPDGPENEKISPALSYVNSLAQGTPVIHKQKSSVDTSLIAVNIPGHISLLDDCVNSKPVYKCNYCNKRLYNETQFFPHKSCQFESKPKPKGKKKRYCICRNTWEGAWKIDMIKCTFCRMWYHGKCMGLSDEFVRNHPTEKPWGCFKCKAEKQQQQTKKALPPRTTRKNVEKTCPTESPKI